MDAILKSQVEKLASDMADQFRTVEDLNGLMRSLMKAALERMLNTEMDVHLGRRGQPHPSDVAVMAADVPVTDNPPVRKNRRNGHSQKTVSGDMGDLTLQTPRDRNGTFSAAHQDKREGP